MIERCEWKFNALKTYLRVNVIHLNASKIEKFKIWNFFYIFPFQQTILPLHEYGWTQGTLQIKYVSYPFPEYFFTDGDWIAEIKCLTSGPTGNMRQRVLKWSQLSHLRWTPKPKSHSSLSSFVSFSFQYLLWTVILFCSWRSVVSACCKHPRIWPFMAFFPLYISYILSC